MRKRKLRLALAILLLAVLGGLTWLVVAPHEPPEPIYQGKRLSAWLDGNAEAAAAVRQIGTNAIPTLLKMLRAHDSGLKLKLVALAQKQHLVKINFDDAEHRNWEAMRGFYLLGTTASNAVPALVKIYDARISDSSQIRTAGSFLNLGPTAAMAIPSLLRTIANTNAPVDLRGAAVNALGHIHAEPELVVPALTKCLRDSDPTVQTEATFSLLFFGDAAKPAVPELVGLLKDKDDQIRTYAEQSLKAIDTEAAAKAGVK